MNIQMSQTALELFQGVTCEETPHSVVVDGTVLNAEKVGRAVYELEHGKMGVVSYDKDNHSMIVRSSGDNLTVVTYWKSVEGKRAFLTKRLSVRGVRTHPDVSYIRRWARQNGRNPDLALTKHVFAPLLAGPRMIELRGITPKEVLEAAMLRGYQSQEKYYQEHPDH